jgi:hypothetical protein
VAEVTVVAAAVPGVAVVVDVDGSPRWPVGADGSPGLAAAAAAISSATSARKVSSSVAVLPARASARWRCLP